MGGGKMGGGMGGMMAGAGGMNPQMQQQMMMQQQQMQQQQQMRQQPMQQRVLPPGWSPDRGMVGSATAPPPQVNYGQGAAPQQFTGQTNGQTAFESIFGTVANGFNAAAAAVDRALADPNSGAMGEGPKQVWALPRTHRRSAVRPGAGRGGLAHEAHTAPAG